MTRKTLWAVLAIGLALVIAPFRLFTVFFVVPGALLLLLSGYDLFGRAIAGRISVHHDLRPTAA